MIRNTLFGLSVLALSAGSAFAAPVKHPAAKTPVVAQADSAAPSDAAKPAKKTKKSTKKATKSDAPKTEMKAPAPSPAPATK
ncbi:MAG TPA: histone [Polyangia bacterium]|nr:histone [Polyangia bacterium]